MQFLTYFICFLFLTRSPAFRQRFAFGLNLKRGIKNSDLKTFDSLKNSLSRAYSEVGAGGPVASDSNKQIDLLYDSECPICMMEVNFLQKRDINNRIRFTDISSPQYDPADHGNVQFADGMRKIRAVLPGGKVVIGVEVFRQTYEAIGLGWVFSLTKFPVIGDIADRVYDIWAENRLRLTGRKELAEVLKDKAEELRNQGEVECDSDACGIDYGDE